MSVQGMVPGVHDGLPGRGADPPEGARHAYLHPSATERSDRVRHDLHSLRPGPKRMDRFQRVNKLVYFNLLIEETNHCDHHLHLPAHTVSTPTFTLNIPT